MNVYMVDKVDKLEGRLFGLKVHSYLPEEMSTFPDLFTNAQWIRLRFIMKSV